MFAATCMGRNATNHVHVIERLQSSPLVYTIEDENMVKTFGTHRFDPALGDRIRLGRFWRCEHDFAAFGIKDRVEAFGEL